MGWFQRIRNVLRPERLSTELDREMEFHLAERTDELIATGLSPAEARREARRRFGNVGQQREKTREMDLFAGLESLLQDLRYAARGLKASPGFALVAILSLGLGIGVNTAVFSLLDSVLLKTLPVQEPAQLYQITRGENGGPHFTNPIWEQVRERQDVFSGVFAYSSLSFNLSQGGVARRVNGNWVSGDYFRTLGVMPAAGRLLQVADDVRGCPAVAVLSHGFWQSEYGGAAGAIGQTIALEGKPFQIVGVTQPGFSGVEVGRQNQIFAPLCSEAVVRGASSGLDQRSYWFLQLVGRLKPEVSLAMAQARLAAVAPAVQEATVPPNWPAEAQQRYRRGTLDAQPAATGLSELRMGYRDALLVLMAVVGIVLWIACANVGHLLLARAAGRQREMAVRLALGAGRGRLIRQLLTENLMLSLLGAIVGILFARWAADLLVGMLANPANPVWLDLTLNGRVLAFAIGIAVANGILFGLLPAWRATQIAPQDAIKAGTGGSGRKPVAGNLLVVGQVALSLVLLVSAGLLLGTLRRLNDVDPGFRQEGILLVSADFEKLQLEVGPRRAMQRQLLERVRVLPGVRNAGAAFFTPISGHGWNDFFSVEGFTPQDPEDGLVYFNAVSEGYFETLETARLAGRDFEMRDAAGAGPVAIINESLARKFFGDSQPLGRTFRTGEAERLSPPIEVIGLVRDAKYIRLQEENRPTAYYPLAQAEDIGSTINLVLRTDGPPSDLVPAISAAAQEISSEVPLDFKTLSDQVSLSLARPRLLAVLSGFFGALALLLAILGLYGTIAYSVTRRRKELGIRIALGSSRGRVVRRVAREAGLLIAGGLVLGLGLALAATQWIASFLFGVTAWDPSILATSALGLTAVALIAGLIPAWRASRLDPMVVLREE